MGCCGSSPEPKANPEADGKAIENFLTDKGNLDQLWNQFDKDNNGTIDADEFRTLIYSSLTFFCQKRNPDLPAPNKEQMGPFIDKLVKQLQPFVDKDQDMQITKDKFASYGTYLTTEFAKLQKELEG